MNRIIRKLRQTLKSAKPPDSDRLLVVTATVQLALDLYTTFAR